MKKYILITLVIALSLTAFYSPMMDTKMAHVDTEYILKKIPNYNSAVDELDQLADQYKKDIENRYKEIDSLYKIYQKEEVLLPQETKIKKQNEIIEKENKARELQKKYFGEGGLLDQKREELLKPIQDNVYEAIKKIAEEGNYDYIYDKFTNRIVYMKPARDLSDAVLKKLNY